LVLGAGGFIGAHLVTRLVRGGMWVRGVDLRHPPFARSEAQDYVIGDLRDPVVAREVCRAPDGGGFDEIYQLAADMGGADYIFTGAHDLDILSNNGRINHNVVDACRFTPPGRVFFASSACVYPRACQSDPDRIACGEEMAVPADPDSPYGWEKLMAEEVFLALWRGTGIPVRIARYHNIFGPACAWNDGREKAPAALCRKVAAAPEGGCVAVYGDGEQRRSFLDIEEALDGTLRLMRSEVTAPLNIGSAETVSIAQLVRTIAGIAGKRVRLVFEADKPTGVRARTSDNSRIAATLGWQPSQPLETGLRRLYPWVAAQVAASARCRPDAAA
jgi:nucleoside-diphosphate-sugar epimerase